MKKNFVRIVAALLVAMLALTLLPLGALAADVTVDVGGLVYDKDKPKASDTPIASGSLPPVTLPNSVTIKTSDYDEFIESPEGAGYDLDGVIDASTITKPNQTLNPSSSVTFTQDGLALLIYTPHKHGLSRWYSDGTTHWRECLVCKKHHAKAYERFMYQNWCQDGDEDGICNICGGDVPYHDVTVIEDKGGKITINRDNACHRMKITADVEPAEGYKLKKLHFVKVRDDGSEQEITRYKKNGQFWTYMPTYDLEVSAEFVKIKSKK